MVEDLDYTFISDPEPSEEYVEEKEPEVVLSYNPFPQSSYSYSYKVANSFGCKYENLINIEDKEKEEEKVFSFEL